MQSYNAELECVRNSKLQPRNKEKIRIGSITVRGIRRRPAGLWSKSLPEVLETPNRVANVENWGGVPGMYHKKVSVHLRNLSDYYKGIR